MINHIRTLLLNRGGDTGVRVDIPGEEFVPPAFRARKLSAGLRLVWQTLFGTAPDRAFQNFRLQQILSLIHGTELEGHALEPDPRITYWPFNDEYYDSVFVTEVLQLAGVAAPLYLVGSHVADAVRGRCAESWELAIVNGDTATVLQESAGTPISVDYTLTGGLSQPVALPGSGLSARFNTPVPGTVWQVASIARPQGDLGQLLARLETTLGLGGMAAIFVEPYIEPFLSLKGIWDEHPLSLHRYGALLIALALRIETCPQA